MTISQQWQEENGDLSICLHRTISQHWQGENGSLSICLHHDYQPTLARRERGPVDMPTTGLSANTGKKRTGACRYAYNMTISQHWQEENGSLSICLHQDYQPTLARREREPVDMPTPGLSANTGKKRTGACRYAYTRTISQHWQEENGSLSICHTMTVSQHWQQASRSIIGVGRFRILGDQGLEYWGRGGPRGGLIPSMHMTS